MKQLLTLISLVCILTVNAKNFYEIKEGDTLYSIAKNNGVSVQEIINENSSLALSADSIYAGQIVKMPKYFYADHLDICSPYGTLNNWIPLLYQNIDQAINECIKYFESKINTDKFNNSELNIYELDYLDAIYIANKIAYLKINNLDPSYFINILEAMAINDNLYAQNALCIHETCEYLYHGTSKRYEIFFYQSDYVELNKACTSLLDDNEIEDYFFLLQLYDRCSNYFFSIQDNKFLLFDKKTINLINRTNIKNIYYAEINAITNVAYHYLNSNMEDAAYSATNSYINLKCDECPDAADFYNLILNAELENTFYFSERLWNGVKYFFLNHTSAGIEYLALAPERIIESRDVLIEGFKINNNKRSNPDMGALLADTSSDTGLKLIKWGQCENAKPYIDMSLDFYKENIDIYGTTDNSPFIEPLLMAICYIFTLEGDKSSEYIKISKENYKKLALESEIDKLLLDITDIYSKTMSDESRSNDEVFNFLLNFSNLVKNSDFNEGWTGYIENFETFIVLYTDIYYYFYNLENSQEYNLNLILDPISLIDLKERIFIYSDLLNLRYDSKNNELYNLKERLNENVNRISDLQKEDNFSYKELVNLNKEQLVISNKILDIDTNLSLLKRPQFRSLKDLQDSLKSDEYAYYFIDSFLRGLILVISNDSIFYENSYPLDIYKPYFRKLKDTLNPSKIYDFELSRNLANVFFPHIFDGTIKKDSTIYLQSINFNGIPPSILVSNYDNSKDISNYERLITADWLVKDYTFARKISIPSNNSTDEYKSQFLGYGNSSTYRWVGLPNLNEVNDEIINLALSSFANKDDLLLNNRATKENFLRKLNNNYKRVVISTHSVSSNWEGLTDEPALIFNSTIGDYFLTPSEIINLDMNSDMVVLSSCSSSIKGFDDLSASFIIAGAKALVHTNWNLDSKFAKNFTADFFKELWLNDENKHEAIRAISLKYLSDFSNPEYAHPAYWGNFSIVYNDLN